MITDVDRQHLRRCVDLASQALDAGDEPFGSILVAGDGTQLHEDRNRIVTHDDPTYHPEIELVHWANQHLTAAERADATVYTSGEHCPMCSAAHGWSGLGRIVYASSSAQLGTWLQEWGVNASPIWMYSIEDIVVDAVVDGPVAALAEQVRQLHWRKYHA